MSRGSGEPWACRGWPTCTCTSCRRGCYTGPGPFGTLLARYPDLTAIVAHLGAPDYDAFLQMAADYERVALDTTMVFTGFFVRATGAGRRRLAAR